MAPDDSHWLFKHYNRSKRGIALDLGNDEGRQALYRLVEKSDVFLTSFLEPTRKKLGFDVDQLRAVNSNIIYAKGSGAGPLGPDSQRGGYDSASGWARGSLSSSAMTVGRSAEPFAMVGHGDGMSGLAFAGGIVAALLHRVQTGEAITVDSSLLGTAAWFNAPAIIGQSLGPDRAGLGTYSPREAGHWSMSTYRTQDDRFISLCYIGDYEDQFVDLCQLVSRPDLVKDSRFASTQSRAENSGALVHEMEKVFAEKSLVAWKSILAAAKGVWAPVQAPAEMLDDAQVQANRMIRQVPDSKESQPIVMPPVMFNQDAGPCNPAPNFGEHTSEVLSEIAGYTTTEIDQMRSAGVVY